jgi:hypothetical protein
MNKILAISALAGVVILAGCSGGGSGSNSIGSTTGGSTRAAVMLTDSFREDFGHVWATIYHVELVPQGGGAPVVLYDNSAGVQIDLKTLRDANGNRYSFLGNAAIPAGTYTALHISIGSTMQLFQNGAAVGNPIPVSSTIPLDSSGHPQLTLTFKSPKTLGSGTNYLIIDFDLANFVLTNSGVLPAIAEGTGSGLNNPTQAQPGEYQGTVSNLTGTSPTLTFTLTSSTGTTTTVVTSASTAIYGSNNGMLQNGGSASVNGTLDPTTGNLVATEIEVGPSAATSVPSISGTASNINATAGTFAITPVGVRGFLPGTIAINVVTNSSTIFYTDPGTTATAAAFFTALATTPAVSIQGTYDSTTSTFTAITVKITNPANEGGWENGPHPFRGSPKSWGNGHL